MYTWVFFGCDVYGKNFSYKIKANDKATAIKNGIAKVVQKNGCNTNKWQCNLYC